MHPISTLDLSKLPPADQLKRVLKSMATLDAILCPDWEDRYYSFDARWDKGEEMGSMRNGQGDDFFALFNVHGCFLKGFVHDSPLADCSLDPAEHYRGVPATFESCVTEPSFKSDQVTFCLWRGVEDPCWSHNDLNLPPGDDPDGSAYLLSPLDGQAETYWQWAESYYEQDLPLHAVRAIYQQQPMTSELAAELNPEVRLRQVKDDLREIGYPF